MAKENTLDSKLENNCYAGMEVTLHKGENFEMLYTGYLKKRVRMSMGLIAEYADSGGDVSVLEKALFKEDK